MDTLLHKCWRWDRFIQIHSGQVSLVSSYHTPNCLIIALPLHNGIIFQFYSSIMVPVVKREPPNIFDSKTYDTYSKHCDCNDVHCVNNQPLRSNSDFRWEHDPGLFIENFENTIFKEKLQMLWLIPKSWSWSCVYCNALDFLLRISEWVSITYQPMNMWWAHLGVQWGLGDCSSTLINWWYLCL